MEREYTLVAPEDSSYLKTSLKGVLVWRFINAIMTIFFLLAAYVNINDADWYIWVPMYAIPGCLSLVSCVKPDSPNYAVWRYTAVIFLLLCIALAVYVVVSAIELPGGRNPLHIEEGRELSGLLIMVTWVGMSRFTIIGRPGSTIDNKVLRNALLLIVCLLAITPVFIWSLCLHDTVGKSYFGHCKSSFQDYNRKQEF